MLIEVPRRLATASYQTATMAADADGLDNIDDLVLFDRANNLDRVARTRSGPRR